MNSFILFYFFVCFLCDQVAAPLPAYPTSGRLALNVDLYALLWIASNPSLWHTGADKLIAMSACVRVFFFFADHRPSQKTCLRKRGRCWQAIWRGSCLVHVLAAHFCQALSHTYSPQPYSYTCCFFFRFLERVLIESKCLPLDTLGIIPGKVCWMLCVDVVVCAVDAAIE